MKTMTKRILSMLFAMVMLLSIVAMAGISAQAAATTFSTEADIDEEKILFTITAEKFRFPYADLCSDGVYDDPDSSLGKAAVFSYTDRAATGEKGLTKALTPASTLAFYCYGQTTKKTDPIGEPTIAELKTISSTEGYTVLLFQDVPLFPVKGDYYAYLFDCWGLQIPFTSDQVNSCVGELVDVYLSIKITGNVTDPVNDPPTYYVDKVVVCQPTAGEQAHECTFGEWTTTDVEHSRTCADCGKTEKSAHDFDAGVVTKQASYTAEGEKVFTCKTCGATKTMVIDRLEDIQEPGTSQNSSSASKAPSTGLIIAIVMIVVAVAIVVVAVVLLKPKKK